MKKFLRLCLLLCCALSLFISTAKAAVRQPLSEDYLEKYFTTVAAASCLGVYLPEQSTEFSYLRSYGWEIMPHTHSDGKVETNFAIAVNYFPEIQKNVYLVTFRGSASKGDWKVNLKTHRVNYGGSTLAEMEKIAAGPDREGFPLVHAGFNEYVDAVLRSSVVDENGKFKGVFQKAAAGSDAFLVLTGHSLGGAAATLLGERLISLGLPRDKFTVITFGAPAIGNQEFATAYGDALNLVRITNSADPIPGSLQTFFGGYKQFGRHVKYTMSPKISSVQHDMAMYFDYSVSEYYQAFDRQVELGRLQPVPSARTEQGVPVVALWINTAEKLQQVASVTDIKRFAADEFKRMLPSYMVMDTALHPDAYATKDVVRISREAGADYVLICGVDGKRPQNHNYWYLSLEQALFDSKGNMLLMSSYAKKVAPAVGNIQALGENLLQFGKDLQERLPFVRLQHEPKLTME